MKLVFFSDLHVHPWSEFGTETRLQDCVSVLSDVYEYCVEHRVRAVFFGGDLFHRKGIVHTRPYVMVANELARFREAEIPFYSVDGNHDHEDKDGTTHALQPLMQGGLMRGIDATRGYRIVRVKNDWGRVTEVHMFSYCAPEVLKQRVKRVRKKASWNAQFHIALFHHGFKGARVGSTIEYEVPEPTDASKLKLDEHYDLVWSGHYHSHQAIKGLMNGYYIGSPLEHTRSDRYEDITARKGFIVVDVPDQAETKDLTWELVPLRRPRFLRVVAENGFVDAKLWNEATLSGHFVDLMYDDPSVVDSMVKKLQAWGARGINPVPLPKAKSQERQRLNVDPSLDPRRVLKRYVKYKSKDIEKRGLNPKLVLKAGIKLLQDDKEKKR